MISSRIEHVAKISANGDEAIVKLIRGGYATCEDWKVLSRLREAKRY